MPCFSIRSRLLNEEFEVRMEGAICQGWLVKSPPEQKMPGPRRIFTSKWRRRYFVLGDVPASVSLPGSCGRLEYYDSAKCTKRKGSIDLDQCEEVTIALGLYDHPYLFALVSKHKGRNRTYFLAADTEETMNHWVECLCKVCGFKPNDEINDGGVSEQWPAQPAPTPERYTIEVARTEIPQQMPDIVPPNRSQEPERAGGGLGNYPARKSKTPSPAFILNRVPPAPSRVRPDSLNSIPDELAPPPPDKGIPRESGFSDLSHDPSTYDHPRSYENMPPTKQERSISRHHDSVSSRQSESMYQVPPHPAPVVSQGPLQTPLKRPVDNNSMYTSVPPAQSIGRDHPSSKRDSNSSSGSRGSTKQDSAYSSEDTYDAVPLPRKVSAEEVERLSQNLRTSTLPSSGGNRPSSKMPTHQKSQSVNNINNHVPPPPHRIVQPSYINLPANSKSHPSYANIDMQGRGNSHTSIISSAGGDSTYDIPPQRPRGGGGGSHVLAMSPPPPHHAAPVHPYVNTVTCISDTTVPPPSASSLITSDATYLPMASNQPNYLPMSTQSASPNFQDRFVPVPSGDRTGTDSYLIMEGQNSAASNDSMYFPMERRDSDTYAPMDRPTSDTYMPVAQNVPPRGGTYEESYVSMVPGDRTSSGSVYTDMSQAPPVPPTPTKPSIYEVPPSNKPVPYVPPRNVEPPRLQPQSSNSNLIDTGAFVYTTQRTRSFKREVPRLPPQADPLLPTKRSGESSSSEDEDDESSSSLDQSSDAIPTQKPPKVEELRGKKSLNSTPPPPKRAGEVQYLDLALENDSASERSPVFPRSPPPSASRHGNASPTEYKEIDFLKTNALKEVRRATESKRKSSDKSIDE